MTPKLQQYLLYQGAIHIEHIYGSVIITAYAKKYALLLTKSQFGSAISRDLWGKTNLLDLDSKVNNLEGNFLIL